MKAILRTLTLLGLAPLLAAADEPTQGIEIELIAKTSAIQPGEPFLLGLAIHHHEDFHTYWKSPGIVGMATTMEWVLPEGFQAGPLQWPAPERVDMSGHPAHGYTRDILLVAEITPPQTLTEPHYTFTGTASWMACAASCHPGHKKLSITLPVATDADPTPTQHERFKAAKAEIPQAASGWSGSGISSDEGEALTLTITPPPGTPAIKDAYFFSSDGQISSAPPQTLDLNPEGAWLIRTPRSEFGPGFKPDLPGILQITHSDGTQRSISLTLKIDEKTPALAP